MRIIQGTALGGQYGGAAIYVAEHAPATGAARCTSWIQTSAAFGLVGALLVIFLVRGAVGEARFADAGWTGGWRIPFLRLGRPAGDLDLDAAAADREPGLPGAMKDAGRGPRRPTPRPSATGRT